MPTQERTLWRDYELYETIRSRWNIHTIIYSPQPQELCLLEYTTNYTNGTDTHAALVYYTYHKRHPRHYKTKLHILQKLAEYAEIPLIHAQYWTHNPHYYFLVTPIVQNQQYLTQPQLLNETEFVTLLYKLRNTQSTVYRAENENHTHTPYNTITTTIVNNHQPPLINETPSLAYPTTAISTRHRTWGTHCLATDIDTITYNEKKLQPTAIIEFKRRNTPEPADTQTSSHQALTRLAQTTKLPFLTITYTPEPLHAFVCANNLYAKTITTNQHINEHQLQQLIRKLTQL